MKLGKVGRFSQKVNRKVKQVCLDRDIPYEYCEQCIHLGSPESMAPHVFVATAHRHKRDWYKENKLARLGLLYDYKQFLRLCQWHHNKIEFNDELTEELFQKLRGEEEI